MLFPICGNLFIFIRLGHLLFVDILTKFQRGNYVDMHFSRKKQNVCAKEKMIYLRSMKKILSIMEFGV